MSGPSVVILTEPANCALADGQLLLQAVLQAQELSREGVPVSQAFCDNPAAAEAFLEAYASAYPGLQLQTPDLPLPEQLYTMLAEGRLAPLPGVNPGSEGPAPASLVTSSPLVVLSLGSPEAFIQALHGNRFAKRNVNVVEIPPVEPGATAAISVAAAVAAHAIAGPSWNPEISRSPGSREDDEGPLAPAEEAANAPLKLDSAEFNLNYIESNDDREQAHRAPPAADIVGTGAGAAAAGALQSAHAESWTADGGNAGAPAAAAGAGPEPEARDTVAVPASPAPAAPEPVVAAPEPVVAAPEPVVVSRPSPGEEPRDLEEGTPSEPPPATDPDMPPPAGDVEAAAPVEEPPAWQDASISNPDTAAPAQGSAGDAGWPGQEPEETASDDSLPEAEQVAGEPSKTAPLPAADASDPEEDAEPGGSSFSDPGEDVIYPPTGGLTSDDDVPYPLPLAAAPEANGFGAILQLGMADEIVDFEAMRSGDADHAAWSAEPFDPVLMGTGGPDGLGHFGFGDLLPDAEPDHFEKPTPHHDDHEDDPVVSIHDLDH